MIEPLVLSKCNNFSNLIQIPIPKFSNKHYVENCIIGIYYIEIDGPNRYYYNFTHPDWIPNKDSSIFQEPMFSLEKKLLLNNKYPSGIDLNFLLQGSATKFCESIPRKFLQYKSGFDNNELVPLVKLFEVCEDIYTTILSKLEFTADKIESAKKIDHLFYNSLYKTEVNQIIKLEDTQKVFYSDYNPYTITSRPTNTSGGINFTALSKKDDTRSRIISGTGFKFVQYDYTAFHPYLISKILNIKIPSNVDYYMYINEQFHFSNSQSRDKIKEDFFKLIYGYRKGTNTFSEKIDEFEEILYKEYLDNKCIKSFFLKRKLFFKTGLDKNVLFNYYLQNMETEHNLLKLIQIMEQIPQSEAALALYIYDSFIFKIHENNSEIIKKIELILTREGFPVKTYIGNNLQDLQLLD